MLKLSKRTADQVRAFQNVDGATTTKTTIAFDSVEDAARIVEQVYGASRGDKGKRQAVASVRRALLAAVQEQGDADRNEAAAAASELVDEQVIDEMGETVGASEALANETAARQGATSKGKGKGAAKSKGPKAAKVPEPELPPFVAPKGFGVVELPTAKVVDFVGAMLARQEVAETTASLVPDRRLLLVALDVERAGSLISSISAYMSAIVKENRGANMYAEGKLRGVRTAVLALVPGSEAGLPAKKTAGAAKADKVARVEALNAKLRADREAKEAAKAAKEAKKSA